MDVNDTESVQRQTSLLRRPYEHIDLHTLSDNHRVCVFGGVGLMVGRVVRILMARAAFGLAFVLAAPAGAQGAAAAFDLQTGCLVGSIPNAQRLSISWTGECVSGSANGVGDVIAFSSGALRYILRGEFRAGQLRRQDNVRDCGTVNCADDVPASLVRLHQQTAAKSAASPPAPVSAPVAEASVPSAPSASATTMPLFPPANVAPSTASAPSAPAEIRGPDALYRGAFTLDPKTGIISGNGRVEFTDGRSYQGALKNGRKTGVGTHLWADGLRYEGNWVDDVQSGRGKLVFVNGDSYEGDFVANERTGQGVFRQKNGNTYSGLWLRGQREGSGTEEWANGQRYEGGWKDNRKEGLGRMRFPDGGTYEGPWVNDQATGQGDIVFASGDVYTGDVANGVPNGQGIFRWGSGDRFEGQFDAGKPTAKGEMTFMFDAVAANLPPPEPAPVPVGVPLAAVTVDAPSPAAPAPPSRATLCATTFNAANSAVALRKFLDSYPDDECARHALARQKIAAIAERDKLATRAVDEKVALAKTLIGGVVAFQQEFSFCVAGSGASCQRVTYVFDVTAKIRDIDVQKRTARVQIIGATSLGNTKRAPDQLFAEGRAAATQDYKSRNVGALQSKSLEEVGLSF